MNAVSSDHQIAMPIDMAFGIAIHNEMGGCSRFVLRDIDTFMGDMDVCVADPFANGLVQDALKAAAVDGELRHLIAGIETARLAPDLLSEPVCVDQLVGTDAE